MDRYTPVRLGRVLRSRTTLTDPQKGTASSWRISLTLKPRPARGWIACFEEAERQLGLGGHGFRLVGHEEPGYGYGYGYAQGGAGGILGQALRRMRRRLRPSTPVLLEFNCAPSAADLEAVRGHAAQLVEAANTLYRERLSKREQAWQERNAALEALDTAVRDVESRRRHGIVAGVAGRSAGVLQLLVGFLAARDL